MRPITAETAEAIRNALLRFYDASARPLPWRGTDDPYAVWISEVMAQQTRVETVVPYYERWLRSFPDVHTLADADETAVLKAWEGLGYYSRARNLHRAARLVRDRHAGSLPGTYDALRALPGVGDYTAGAVASIAFGQRHPAIDGNARRVLARLLDHPDPPLPLLRETMHALLPADRPGDFNQAVMELGATICTPRAPKCSRCPVRDRCAAHAAGSQAERPRPKPKKPVPLIGIATAVLRDARGRMMLVRRPARGLLGGLWSFPGEEVAGEAGARSAVLRIAELHGVVRGEPRELGTVQHTFSHRRERYYCHALEITPRRRANVSDVAWLSPDDRSLPLPRAQQRIRNLALAAS